MTTSTPPKAIEDLDSFFPLPSPPSSRQLPARLPGITHASSVSLVNTLKDNHVKWHAYFNDRGFHNHASHHLVAIYAMGAGGPLIEAAYQTHVAYMRPAFQSPEPIDDKSFWLHLGKREFYNSYLEFFRSLLRSKDVTEVLEEYVFSAKANVGGTGIEGEPNVLARFLAALVHPLIHVGNGLEFGLLGLVAEGLAQAATHRDQGKKLVPAALFQHRQKQKDAQGGSVSRLTSLIPSLTLRKRPSNDGRAAGAAESKSASVHAFSILARVAADEKFSPASLGLPPPEEGPPFDHVEERVGDALAELAAEWAADLEGEGSTPAAIDKKIEELIWMNAIIYGVGGWAGRERAANKQFNADFFNMHLVTSSLFLPTFSAYLSPRSMAVLLRTYFALSLAWYIARGRPALPIREFYEATTDKPTPPNSGQSVSPAKDTLTPEDVAPNPWLPIIQTTIVHPGEHVCKLQRALLHNATAYGTREAGHFTGTGLEGAEVLDGTLFIRAAGLTAARVGWMKEGQPQGGGFFEGSVGSDWDRSGFV
ncbi:hypothetical protein BV20DRAFT_534637 [Pilatotrama ljubarskyi]|nr:hypothetical protein BV20DRAFT_534637 [Pilatotrama ljubarskyi]